MGRAHRGVLAPLTSTWLRSFCYCASALVQLPSDLPRFRGQLRSWVRLQRLMSSRPPAPGLSSPSCHPFVRPLRSPSFRPGPHKVRRYRTSIGVLRRPRDVVALGDRRPIEDTSYAVDERKRMFAHEERLGKVHAAHMSELYHGSVKDACAGTSCLIVTGA